MNSFKFFSREVASKLLNKNLNTFAAERQRGEMPLAWRGGWKGLLYENGVGVSEGAEAEAQRGYTVAQIFLALIRDEFVEAFLMDKKRAAEIASHASQLLNHKQYWPLISEGSRTIVQNGGCAPTELAFAQFQFADGNALYGIREMSDLGSLIAALPAPTTSCAFINITRTAAKLRERAARDGVDIEHFW